MLIWWQLQEKELAAKTNIIVLRASKIMINFLNQIHNNELSEIKSSKKILLIL